MDERQKLYDDRLAHSRTGRPIKFSDDLDVRIELADL
jgi:hypothetical protein